MHPRSGAALSDVLFDIAADTTRPRISIGELLQALDDRALAAAQGFDQALAEANDRYQDDRPAH